MRIPERNRYPIKGRVEQHPRTHKFFCRIGIPCNTYDSPADFDTAHEAGEHLQNLLTFLQIVESAEC